MGGGAGAAGVARRLELGTLEHDRGPQGRSAGGGCRSAGGGCRTAGGGCRSAGLVREEYGSDLDGGGGLGGRRRSGGALILFGLSFAKN